MRAFGWLDQLSPASPISAVLRVSCLTVTRCVLRCVPEMPRLGRARRKTRPSLCGHSVGSIYCLLLLPFPQYVASRVCSSRESSCDVYRKCPGLGGPGGKPAQACV